MLLLRSIAPYKPTYTQLSRRGRGFQRAAALMDDRSPTSVIQKQLEYYNARDLDMFMTLIADDVYVTDAETGKVLASSAEELRPRYVERFKTPVHCELLGRLCLGDVVVDREIITGLPNEAMADCLATYTVKEGKITKIQFVWRPRQGVVNLG